MIRPIRVDHTKFLQVAIKTHSFRQMETGVLAQFLVRGILYGECRAYQIQTGNTGGNPRAVQGNTDFLPRNPTLSLLSVFIV